MFLLEKMMNYIDSSPTAYNAIDNLKNDLLTEGFIALDERQLFAIKPGNNYFIVNNDSSIIAFKIGDDIDRNYGFNIVSSHSDSPCFKLKPNYESTSDIYNRINVEPYGSMICSTWLDRPLNVAGRVLYEDEGNVKTQIVNLDRDLIMIPNMCIHFNRDINSGHAYKMDVDMQAFIGQNLDLGLLKTMISNEIGNKRIINSDLYLCNHQKAVLWGVNKEYISSPRLDDLECVFTSYKGFIDGNHPQNITVLAVFDNEEVGSSSRQGADSNYFNSILKRINASLGFSEEVFYHALSKSYMISADNAHAVHPNNISITDSNNHVYMNKGIVIKFNASNTYTSDGFSASLLQQLCEKNNIPYQFFSNRSDLRGGSTLGNIANSHLPIITIDIGLAQLAMHSCYETAGAEDVEYAYKLFKSFYDAKLVFDENGRAGFDTK